MLSLIQLLASSSPLLLLDAASTRVQVGLFDGQAEDSVRWEQADEEAGIGLFRCVERLGCHPGRVAAFAYCAGPGSTLGIRTAAMAVRTWTELRPRPVFAYQSLALLACALDRPGLRVIADARRGLWHVQDGWDGGLHRVEAALLDAGAGLVTPAEFRHWQPLPPGAATAPYDLRAFFGRAGVCEAPLFAADEDPDAFQHEAPAYVTWTPAIHRAPDRPSAEDRRPAPAPAPLPPPSP